MGAVVGCHGGGRESVRYRASDAVHAARGIVAASAEGQRLLVGKVKGDCCPAFETDGGGDMSRCVGPGHGVFGTTSMGGLDFVQSEDTVARLKGTEK